MELKLSTGIYTGRPATLIRKQFATQVTLAVTNSPRITAIQYHTVGQPDRPSIYMPWKDRSVFQLDGYDATIGCLQGLIDSHLGCLFIYEGNMNVVKIVILLLAHGLLVTHGLQKLLDICCESLSMDMSGI